MRLDAQALVELARWNHRQERTRRTYYAEHQPCRICGEPTYSKRGVHRRCER